MKTLDRPVAEPETSAGVPVAHLSLMMLVQLLWGLNFVVSKVAIEHMPPLMFMAVRFFIVALVLWPFMRWHGREMGLVLLVGICSGAGNFGFMILGLSLAGDVAPIAIAMQLGAPFATILSVIFLGERLGPWRTSAIVLAFAGVVVMGFDPRVLSYLDALALVTVAAFGYAVATVFMRRVRGVGVYDMQGWIAVTTWPVMLAASLVLETDPFTGMIEAGWVGWAGVAYTVVAASLIGHAGIYFIIQRHEITVTAPMLLLAPVIGALSGVLLLGDVLTWRMVAGGVLTLAGVLVITLREGRKRA